jgi:hypothetical protein
VNCLFYVQRKAEFLVLRGDNTDAELREITEDLQERASLRVRVVSSFPLLLGGSASGFSFGPPWTKTTLPSPWKEN